MGLVWCPRLGFGDGRFGSSAHLKCLLNIQHAGLERVGGRVVCSHDHAVTHDTCQFERPGGNCQVHLLGCSRAARDGWDERVSMQLRSQVFKWFSLTWTVRGVGKYPMSQPTLPPLPPHTLPPPWLLSRPHAWPCTPRSSLSKFADLC